MRIVTNRGLQIGDVIVLDISAITVEQEGAEAKNVPAADSKSLHFNTEDGDRVLSGFLDSIIGRKTTLWSQPSRNTGKHETI
ncbi:trigger factor-like protein TIG, Chloroplastic [Rutidosis leptorrhynchoides]|uniref:trigger factor-like protein TIG, Chloroplastic n=1 Tax=Rutidosis leptorrhynchoides TaxID=125765 RepID=UPI003A992297